MTEPSPDLTTDDQYAQYFPENTTPAAPTTDGDLKYSDYYPNEKAN